MAGWFILTQVVFRSVWFCTVWGKTNPGIIFTLDEHVPSEKQSVALYLCVLSLCVSPCLLHTCLQRVFVSPNFSKTFEKIIYETLKGFWLGQMRIPCSCAILESSDFGSACAMRRPGSKAKGTAAFATYILLPAGVRTHFSSFWTHFGGCSSLVLSLVLALLSGYCCSSAWSTLTAWSSLH